MLLTLSPNLMPLSAEVAKFFQPSIDCIVQAVMEQTLKEMSVSEISFRWCSLCNF